jgi:hypothetical protein
MLGRDDMRRERTGGKKPLGPKDVVEVNDQVVLGVNRAGKGRNGGQA